MSKRPLLATAIFASLILSATAAMACPWHDASAQNDPTVVASTAGSAQPDAQTDTSPPPNAN